MSEARVLTDAAAFMDWERASLPGVPRADLSAVVQRFLAACYDDLGKAPRLVDGDDMASLLGEVLPRRFGVRDPLAAHVPDALALYLDWLTETAMVPAAFEARRALDANAGTFTAAVASGAAHEGGVAVTGPGKTIVHRADKVGRNDPCPCGSGKKFKKCCLRLGE
jgi:hypothetical protein